MSDLHSPPRAQVLVRSLDGRQSRPRSVRRRRAARRSRRPTPSRCSARSARGASTCTTTISCRSTRHAVRARSDRQGVQRACERHGIVVPMATVESVLRPGVSRRRVHVQRPARPRVCGAEDDAGDGSRRGARREDLRAVGRPRGHRNRRVPAAGRSGEAAARGGQLSVRVLDRSRSTATGLRSRPSPTSRAATSTWPRPAPISGSFRRSSIPRWSASIRRWRTSRWPD